MKRDEFLSELKINQNKDLEIVKKKNQDYAEGADPFQNFRMVEDAGLLSTEEGIAVRMSDKLQRVFNLIGEDEAAVDDETIADTLSDLRNYANILQVYLENKDSEPENPYTIETVFEGVKQEKIHVEEGEPFTPIELGGDENWYCYVEEKE